MLLGNIRSHRLFPSSFILTAWCRLIPSWAISHIILLHHFYFLKIDILSALLRIIELETLMGNEYNINLYTQRRDLTYAGFVMARVFLLAIPDLCWVCYAKRLCARNSLLIMTPVHWLSFRYCWKIIICYLRAFL